MSVTRNDIVQAKEQSIALFDELLAQFGDSQPITTVEVTYEDAMILARTLTDSNRRADLLKLLESCGAKSMSSLDSSKYERFVQQGRKLLND